MAEYSATGTAWTRPAQGGMTVTAGASRLTHPTTGANVTLRGIAVDGTGTVTVTSPDGTSYTTHTLATGVIHSIAATHVTAATATGIKGYW